MSEHTPVGETSYIYHGTQPTSPNHRKRRQDLQYQPTEDATSFQVISNQWQQQQQQEQEQYELQAAYHASWKAQEIQPSQHTAMHQMPSLGKGDLNSDEINALFMDQVPFSSGEPSLVSFPGEAAFSDSHAQNMDYMAHSKEYQKANNHQGYLELHTPPAHSRDPDNVQLHWTDHPAYTNSQQPTLSPSTPTFFSPAFLEALQEDQIQPSPTYGIHPTLPSQSWQQDQQQPQQPLHQLHQLHQHPQQQQNHDTSPYGKEMPGYAFPAQRQAGMVIPDRPHPHLSPAPSTPGTRPPFLKSRSAGVPMPLNQNSLRQKNAMTHSPPVSPALKRSSSSSSNSSPPVTPMYGRLSNLSIRPDVPKTPVHVMPFAGAQHNYYAHQPPIMEGDEYQLYPDVASSLTTEPSSASPRAVQSATRETEIRAADIRSVIQSYLQALDPVEAGERTIVIMTSKVAQKSYGTEKRFLCPPPTAFLIGTQWWTSKDVQEAEPVQDTLIHKNMALAPPSLSVCISGEASVQAGQIEWYTTTGTAVGQTGPPSTPQSSQSSADTNGARKKKAESFHSQQQDELASGRCVAKNLYISDADEKRKRVECLVRIQLANGMPLGTASSKGIKVISKPSKKRQSVKNMDLCIHHGTAVSLFNRIRSQTVSTKYLGVSTASGMPYSCAGAGKPTMDGTCFVARTSAWDPFVIWIVDRSCATRETKENDTADDYIAGRNTFTRHMPYPPPPAIALKNTKEDLFPIHYNQHVVLQCLSTGLVSPVMVIRKVDKASTVVGGAQCRMSDPSSMSGGGEFGDEILGDPVSQLHKVAFQIVPHAATGLQSPLEPVSNYGSPNLSMPRTSLPVTYLACLNDVVGMHKTSVPRAPVHPHALSWEEMTSQEGGRVVRKRRVSTDVLDRQLPLNQRLMPSTSLSNIHSMYNQEVGFRRRVNSMNDGYDAMHQQHQQRQPNFAQQDHVPHVDRARSVSISVAETMRSNGSSAGKDMYNRRLSLGQANPITASVEAYWHEDVSDAAVWTIVGTDCATYTVWTPPTVDKPSHAPLPLVTHYTLARGHSRPYEDASGTDEVDWIMSLHGESFSRDLEVWFGDVKTTRAEFRTSELLVCFLPSRQALMQGISFEHAEESAVHKVPILLVRGDGIVIKTGQTYEF